MKKWIFAIIAILGVLPLSAKGLYGTWHGEIKMPGGQLPLILHVSKGPSVKLDSPHQGAFDMAADVVDIQGDNIKFTINQIGLSYEGTLSGENIEGKLNQGGASLPLTFEPGQGDALKRPQTPVPPYIYKTEECKFVSDTLQRAELSGTLSLPEGAKTAIVFVTGSGLQDRDETVYGHKPFAVIADYLGRQGIASLRYDDRGYGESTGSETIDKATTKVFAADARAAVDALRAKGVFDKIGVLGHSEGGTIAAMLAAQGAVDFAIGIGTPALRGDSVLTEQNRSILLASGVSPEMTERYCEAFGQTAEFAEKYGATPMLGAYVATLTAQWPQDVVSQTLAKNLASAAQQMTGPWMREFLSYDTSKDIAAAKCPILLIYGEKDTQVDAKANSAAAQEAAKSNKNVEVQVIQGLNHIMQHAQTGNIAEYALIEETVAQEIFDAVEKFLKKK